MSIVNCQLSINNYSSIKIIIMKKTIIAAILAVSGFASAQQSKTFKTSEYDKISVSSSYTVVLVKGKEGEITATGNQEDLSNLVVETKGVVLKIRPEKQNWKGNKNKVTITIPFESVDGVTLSGSGSITSSETLKADTFNVAVSGSGRINLKIDAKTMEAALSGSGRIELAGKTAKSETNISGSGKILAYALQSAVADANVSGSGSCEVNCTEAITARISGSGRISYKGNPEKEDTKVAGSGSISKS